MTAESGMLVIDKPPDVTSHDVVSRVRGRLGVKAGHTGTLDPQATGVLLVCLEKATRLARFLQGADKVYEGTIRFGWETDTYDAQGEALAEPVPVPEMSDEEIATAVAGFVGEIEQVPPAYSAKKVRGEPSYRRARRGEVVEHEPTTVRIDAIDVLEHDGERLRVRVECGSGTYVRTLAVDIGRALGCPAHLEALRRVRVGSFGLEEAVDGARLDEIEPGKLAESIVPPARMLARWPAVVVTEPGVDAVRHGGVVEPGFVSRRIAGSRGRRLTGGDEGAWIRILDEEERMIAAAEARPGGVLQPRIVLVTTA